MLNIRDNGRGFFYFIPKDLNITIMSASIFNAITLKSLHLKPNLTKSLCINLISPVVTQKTKRKKK